MLTPALGSKLRQSGQQVYVTMLVLTCVFLAVAIAFPTYEYIAKKYWEKPASVSTQPLTDNTVELLSGTGIEDDTTETPAAAPAGDATE